MEKESLPTGKAMGMKVAYSNAISVKTSELKRLVWISGQLAYDEDEELTGIGNIEIQTEQCIKNIESVLRKLHGTLDDVVQVTVFVKEMTGLKKIHEVRLKYFREPFPTSTLVEVKGFVHPDALIEINAVAAI